MAGKRKDKRDGKLRIPVRVRKRLDWMRISQYEPVYAIVERLLDEHDKKLKRQKGRKSIR